LPDGLEVLEYNNLIFIFCQKLHFLRVEHLECPERSVAIDERDKVISVKDSESDCRAMGLNMTDFEKLSVDCGHVDLQVAFDDYQVPTLGNEDGPESHFDEIEVATLSNLIFYQK
jgi:hypothetical protein